MAVGPKNEAVLRLLGVPLAVRIGEAPDVPDIDPLTLGQVMVVGAKPDLHLFIGDLVFLAPEHRFMDVLDGLMNQGAEQDGVLPDRSELQLLEEAILLGAALINQNMRGKGIFVLQVYRLDGCQRDCRRVELKRPPISQPTVGRGQIARRDVPLPFSAWHIPLLGHTKIESTVRYLGVDIEDALILAEGTEI